MADIEVIRRSTLAAPAAQVWAAVTTMDGVNAELRPWVRMTHPAGLTDLRSGADELIGRVAFHSVLLAGGVVPFDRHSLRLESVEDRGDLGGGFVEESTTLMQRRWRHERDVLAVDERRCTVTDRLVVEPRLALAAPIVARAVPWLFARRHRHLVELYGQG